MLNNKEMLEVLKTLKSIESTEVVKEARRSLHRLLVLDKNDVLYDVEVTSLKSLLNTILN